MSCSACKRRREALKAVAGKVTNIVARAFIRKDQRQAQIKDRLERISLNRSTGGSQEVDTYE